MVSVSAQLSRAAWIWVAQRTVFVAFIAVVGSVAAAYMIMEAFSDGLSGVGLAASITLPALVGGPMICLHQIRMAQLRDANNKLQVLASTDWLTSCLNRRAFTNTVNGHLSGGGALLVIDADNFKFINDQHGHDRGDEVLQLLAATIRDNVREQDVVGRIGGEEFGVFLRGANRGTARFIAERIRYAVQSTQFAPNGLPVRMSVSIGGVCFEGDASFSNLFRTADQRLYGVKQSGRNRIDIADVDDDFIETQALAS